MLSNALMMQKDHSGNIHFLGIQMILKLSGVLVLGFCACVFNEMLPSSKKMKKKKRSFSGTLTKISMFSVGVQYSDSGRREKEVLENILLENSWNRWCHRNGY